ncbi:unnamed protein product [Somion occarium]|uniref:Cytochrome P450 n=1 Tax=Somion occarium TaxID=3059160 RepID=A0ABP1DKZ0_9APHY
MIISWTAGTVVIVVTVFTFLAFRIILYRQRLCFLGPIGLPIIGNILQIPHDRQWLKFDQWIRLYGDVVGLHVLGQPTLILGSAQAANETLDARGNIYSDRPVAVMAGELVGWNQGLGYSPGPHSHRFREFRRLFHRFIGPRSAQHPRILRMQEQAAANLLLKIMQEPTQFMSHVRQSTGAVILRLAYGYNVTKDQDEDPLVKIVEKAMQGFAKASEPGAFLVDYFPVLKHIPDWVPGAGFKRVAQLMRNDLERLYNVPFNFVKQSMKDGNVTPSFTSTYLEEKGTPTKEDEELIKAAAASLYSGGADTTPSSLASFILAMTLHPSVQARAQAEVDSVLGNSWKRLPTFSHRESLPYVSAIVLELLRWNPAVPLGLAHRLTQDDVYQGRLVPKGTIVWANIWTMLHDEKVFPDPTEFRPERFLDNNGKLRHLERHEDPSVIGFGFGRRICPGMFFADNSIFIAVVMMLYVFKISKARDDQGREIEPQIEYDGFISHPRPFECIVERRSAEAELLVRRECVRMV